MLESEIKSHSNLCEWLSVRARFKGAMDEFEPSDCPDRLPEVHVFVSTDQGEKHDHHEDCWCSPVVEFKTEYVRVYRHRRVQ